MALALSAVVCLACGFALVSLFLSGRVPGGSGVVFELTLSTGFGLGIFSLVFFFARVLAIPNIIAVDVAVLGCLIAGLLLARNAGLSADLPVFSASADEHWPRWFRRVLVTATSIALCGAIYAAIMQTLAHPQGGGWDAFAIWNLHARFLFLAGSHWRDGFSSLIFWSHPDYPLFVPAAIAHLWTFLGYDDPHVPAAVGLLLTFAAIGLLFSSLSLLRGRVAATLASLTLLATPSFVEQGTWQYADIPLAFFFLATIALLAISDEQSVAGESRSHGFLALAGIAAGFATWTKNEGVLFVCAIILARQIVFLRARRKPGAVTSSFLDHSAALLLGSAPLILVIIYFKHRVAPPGDLFTNPASMLHRLLEPTRFETVVKAFVRRFFSFGGWLGIPGTVLLLAFYFIADHGQQRGLPTGHRASILGLFLTFIGYFCVYLITPYDLFWHLRFSLDRLFLQLWPSTVFLFFLLISPQRLPLSPDVSK
jgi:hypothetical protein